MDIEAVEKWWGEFCEATGHTPEENETLVQTVDDLITEVKRLRAGMVEAIGAPNARAYILEHTLKNGADNCCEGRCQGHTAS